MSNLLHVFFSNQTVTSSYRPDIQAVDEVKALSLESTRNVYSQLSGLQDVVEEQTLEREQNDRNVLSDALGEYECDAGMSVEDLPAIVKIKLMKTLKWRLIAHQFNTVCAVGMVKSVEAVEECCWAVCGQL
jgi:hypothetical protein